MADFSDFDRYCDEHDIKPGEEPAAFAAWLHEISGGQWDGHAEQIGGVNDSKEADR
jgi:hypothetical protein